MSDRPVETQLRAYRLTLERHSVPVSLDEARTLPRPTRPVRRLAPVGAAVCVIVIALTTIAVLILRGGSDSRRDEPTTETSTTSIPAGGRWVVPPTAATPNSSPPSDPPQIAQPVPTSEETMSRAHRLLGFLPEGWTLTSASDTRLPHNGRILRSAGYAAPDGIGLVSAIWEDLSQPMTYPFYFDGTTQYEQTPEGEWLLITRADPYGREILLVRPDGSRLSLSYTARYSLEHRKPDVEAQGGPPSAISLEALRGIAQANNGGS